MPWRLILIGVAFVEVALFSLWIDTGRFPDEGTGFRRLVGEAPEFVTALLAVVAATGLVGLSRSESPGLRQRWRRLADLLRTEKPDPAWVLGMGVVHLAALFALAFSASRLFSGADGRVDVPLLIATATAALAVEVTLLGAMLPPQAWRQGSRLLAPFVLAGTAIGLVTTLWSKILASTWVVLSMPTFRLTSALLYLLGQDVVSRPERLVVGVTGNGELPFLVKIDPSCSGYQGIGLVTAFLATYLWMCRKALRFPQALVLIPLGVVAIWLLNVVRLAGLILVGAWVSRDVAAGGFHSQIGWLSFIALALGIVVVTQHSGLFLERDQGNWTNPAAAYLMPFLAIVAVATLGSAFELSSDALYPWRVGVGVIAIFVFWQGSLREVVPLERPTRAAIIAGVAVFVLWVAPLLLGSRADPQPSVASGLSLVSLVWILLRTIGAAVVVPIAEETAFRGYLARRFMSIDFDRVDPRTVTWGALAASSLLFGWLHGRWFEGTLAGLAYGLAYRQTGRLTQAVWAHAITNFSLVLVALQNGDWRIIN